MWKSAPKPLKATGILFLAAGIWTAITPLVLIGIAIYSMLSWQNSLNQFGSAFGDNNGGIGGEFFGRLLQQNGGLLIVLLLILLVAGAGLSAGYVVLAHFTLSGYNIARIIATALAGVSLLGLVAGPLTFIWLSLGVAGVICSWMPSSSAHIRSATAHRATTRIQARQWQV